MGPIAGARHHELGRRHVMSNGGRKDLDVNSNDAIEDVFHRGFAGNRVIWPDTTELTDWESGKTNSGHELLTLISNPISNLLQFYFGASASNYLDLLVRIIIGIASMLLAMYLC